ncbi:cation transporting ATPase C-terminal domain-containing protein [Streptomyces sp. NPDC057690]|uniref:cation-translocating P-type ATPase C-terminal domain-containing protein n=1 Tax=Streptomyces sp. NPDC057690 TaxID=3346214 RepID=UPI0036CDCE9A
MTGPMTTEDSRDRVLVPERSLEALRRMLVPTARVRRDGREQVVEAHTLVPGDLVLLEAGDRVPADGRPVVAESVETAEAALTGESRPVVKGVTATTGNGATPVPLAERTSMLFMNTSLTRGRAELIVIATGMRTELGAIAAELRCGTEPPSPLHGPVLGRHLLRNRTLWLCLAGVLAVQAAAVHLPWANRVFGTVPLDAEQWAVCVATASGIRHPASGVLLAELVARAVSRQAPVPRRARRERE